jgi:hypothetical protein
MLRRALASACHVLSHPRPLIPICLVFAVSNALTAWPRAHVRDEPLLGLIYLVVMVIRTWSALGVQNVALGLARHEPEADAAFRALVSPGVLLQTALVGLGLFAAIIAATLVALTAIRIGPLGYPIVAALVAAVLYGGIAVSQYPLLLLEERADMMDSVMLSAELTKGHRGTLFVAGLIPVLLLVASAGAMQLAGVHGIGDAPLLFVIGFAPIAALIYTFWSALAASLFLGLLADHERRMAGPQPPVVW